MTLLRRPTTSNADDWQLYLQDGLQGEPDTGCAFLAVQIVEAIEEHQKALAREVYRLAEDTAARFSDLASEDTPSGHYHRGQISEAKSIARAICSIMPYSRDPASLKSDVEREMEAAMGPDHSREGIFVYHNCHRCHDGKKPCVRGGPHRCEFPHARND